MNGRATDFKKMTVDARNDIAKRLRQIADEVESMSIACPIDNDPVVVDDCDTVFDCIRSESSIKYYLLSDTTTEVFEPLDCAQTHRITLEWVGCDGLRVEGNVIGLSDNAGDNISFEFSDGIVNHYNWNVPSADATLSWGNQLDVDAGEPLCSVFVGVECDEKSAFPTANALNTYDPDSSPPQIVVGAIGETNTLSNGLEVTCLSNTSESPYSNTQAFNADETAVMLSNGELLDLQGNSIGQSPAGYAASAWSTLDPCLIYSKSGGVFVLYNYCTGNTTQVTDSNGNTIAFDDIGSAKGTISQNDGCIVLDSGNNTLVYTLNGTTANLVATLSQTAYAGYNGARLSPDGLYVAMRYDSGNRLYSKAGQDLGWIPPGSDTAATNVTNHADWFTCNGQSYFSMMQPRDLIYYDPVALKSHIIPIASDIATPQWIGNGHNSGQACDRDCTVYFSNDNAGKVYSIEFIPITPAQTITSQPYNGSTVTGCKADYIVTEWISYSHNGNGAEITVSKSGTKFLLDVVDANGDDVTCLVVCPQS